jgi:Novel toxin 17
MFSPDKRERKPKKSRRLRNNDSDSSPEKPIHPKEFIPIKGRPQSSLLNIPLYPPSNAQDISLSNETGQPERVTKAEDNSGSDVATVAEIDAKSEYQKMGYTDKLSIAVQMVPELLAGDVKQALEQLLCDPAFVAELVAAGVVFAGLQATPAGPLIDAVMVATLGVDVALKLGGFLYKSYTADDENDLKAAAEDLKGFVEIAGMAGATKLLGMAGRALKKLSGEAIVDEPFAPGSLGAAKAWSRKGRIKAAELPNRGKIRYVPPKNWHPSNPLPRGKQKGFIDKFGNEWVKGPSRTKGQASEWDVQLAKNATDSIKALSRDGSHLNVSLDGMITHR